jgi:hypothetical protein
VISGELPGFWVVAVATDKPGIARDSQERDQSSTTMADHNDIRHSPIERVTQQGKFPGERR